jgi:hypothetical protein
MAKSVNLKMFVDINLCLLENPDKVQHLNTITAMVVPLGMYKIKPVNQNAFVEYRNIAQLYKKHKTRIYNI